MSWEKEMDAANCIWPKCEIKEDDLSAAQERIRELEGALRDVIKHLDEYIDVIKSAGSSTPKTTKVRDAARAALKEKS
jgi:hypothetical protein